MSMKVYCPVPDDQLASQALSPRVGSLKGLRIGFLGNLKPNCDVLLHTTEELVIQAGAEATLFREKESCSLGAPAEILSEIASRCHAAVVALGD